MHIFLSLPLLSWSIEEAATIYALSVTSKPPTDALVVLSPVVPAILSKDVHLQLSPQ